MLYRDVIRSAIKRTVPHPNDLTDVEIAAGLTDDDIDPIYAFGDARRYGAADGVDSKAAIQTALTMFSAIGHGELYIAGQYPISSSLEITKTAALADARKGFLRIYGPGRIYKADTFTGDRLITMNVDQSDEDYVQIDGVTIDGVDQSVNGIDWYASDVAYDLEDSLHDPLDSTRTKAVNVFGAKIENCYRGIRSAGVGSITFVGVKFRNNVVGAHLAQATSHDFFGCSFRRGVVGFHMGAGSSSTSLQACVFESNDYTGVLWDGGRLSVISPTFENNGATLTPGLYDTEPSGQCNVYLNAPNTNNALATFVSVAAGESYPCFLAASGSRIRGVSIIDGRTATSQPLIEIGTLSDLIAEGELRISGLEQTLANWIDVSGADDGNRLTINGRGYITASGALVVDQTHNLNITSNAPLINLQDLNGATDQKRLRITNNGGSVVFQRRNDADSSGTTFYEATPGSGTLTDEHIFSGQRLRVPVVSSDPGTLNDGDIWYNSTSDTLKARLNGVTVTITTA